MTIKTIPYKKEAELDLSDGALRQLQDYADKNDMTLEEAAEVLIERGINSAKQTITRRLRG